MCPGLTELTIIFPYPYDAQLTETGILLDPAGRAHPAMSELIGACKGLPDFHTLQIVHFPTIPPRPTCWCGKKRCGSHKPSVGQWDQALEKQAKDLEEYAKDCLKKPETGFWEEGGRRRTTLRVIEFSSPRPCQSSVKIEEYQV